MNRKASKIVGQNEGQDANEDVQADTAETEIQRNKQRRVKHELNKLNMKYKNYKMRVKQQFTRSLGSELTSILVIIFVLGTVYYGLFIAYLWLVHTQFTFTLYYPQFPNQQPGDSVDTRVNFFWFLLVFSMMRLPVGLSFIWLMRRLGVSWKLAVFIILFLLVVILEGFTLISGLVLWALANNPIWPGPSNAANDDRFCQAYGNSWPDYCPAGSYTGLAPDLLKPKPAFVWYLIFNCLFIGVEGLMFIIVPSILDFKSSSENI